MSILKGKSVSYLGLCLGVLLLTSCSTQPTMKMVDYVDLKRFMGDWYVIANIPTVFEKGAHNAIESYSLNDKGKVETTFTFRANSFNGKQKSYKLLGFVRDTVTNAIWGMQFIWPFKSDYRIVFLNEDYTQVVVARQALDYVWIMARDSALSDSDYLQLKSFVAELGYDDTKLVKVPQNWDS
ncbi:MAG: apolipoprotein D and lipocalin family protein [Saprospiraceae bacterium]